MEKTGSKEEGKETKSSKRRLVKVADSEGEDKEEEMKEGFRVFDGILVRYTDVPGKCSILNSKYKFEDLAELSETERLYERLSRISKKLTLLEGKEVAVFVHTNEVTPTKEFIKFETFPTRNLIPIYKKGATITTLDVSKYPDEQ